MTRHVALLRGINVGGKNKVDMKQLKETFSRANAKEITTYINSGNVIFTSNKSKKDLIKALEQGILEDFGLHIKVLLRTLKEIEEVIEKIPSLWRNDSQTKSDVLFYGRILTKKISKKTLVLRA